MCGKNVGEIVTDRTGEGSPPRVREKQFEKSIDATISRITPACAGKTNSQIFGGVICRDHPRVCGKNTFVAIFYPFAAGSPPRVREKHLYYKTKLVNAGITPACAGKTLTSLALWVSV